MGLWEGQRKMFSNKLFTASQSLLGRLLLCLPQRFPASLSAFTHRVSHLQRAAEISGRLLQLMVAINNLS